MTVDPTPLEILLGTMRRKWAEGDADGAVALARVAAPYLHPKAPVVPARGNLAELQDGELDELCELGADGTAAAPDDPG